MSKASNLKIYCVGASNYANWMRGNVCGSMEKADVVVFPGGADINPKLYGENTHPMTYPDSNLDSRDTLEFHKATALGKKMVGICRGAQFLCAMAGGKLVQHQTDFKAYHEMFTFDGKIIRVSSSHHQAMFPWRMADDEYEVLGWSIGLSKIHQGTAYGDEMVIGQVPLDMEVEAAFFPKIQALGIQSHPEWQYPLIGGDQNHKNTIDFWRGVMDRFMNGDEFKESSNAFIAKA